MNGTVSLTSCQGALDNTILKFLRKKSSPYIQRKDWEKNINIARGWVRRTRTERATTKQMTAVRVPILSRDWSGTIQLGGQKRWGGGWGVREVQVSILTIWDCCFEHTVGD